MTNQENSKLWEEYFYPGTTILVNNLNIKDYDKLKEKEATLTFDKLLELRNLTINTEINKDRLNNIHKYLFENIYPFAGKYRKVNMLKERGTFLSIDTPKDIDDKLNELFKEVNEMIKYSHSITDFCNILSKLYTTLIYIHPYREGNGRTIREFIREYSLQKSEELGIGKMELDWSKVNKEELNEYIEVAHLFPSSISSTFMNALTTIDNSKKR